MNQHIGFRACGTKAASATVALTLAASAWAGCNLNIRLTRPDSRYEEVAGAVPAGSELRDKVTGLVWQRCMLGMDWNGSTCAGVVATRLSWVQALKAAQSAPVSAAPGADAWRLPNMKELVSLVETACVPAFNRNLFPGGPGGFAWTSSPYADRASYAWVVDFDYGSHSFDIKSSALPVRLVRSGQ